MKTEKNFIFPPHSFSDFLNTSQKNQIHIDAFFEFIKQYKNSSILLWYAQQLHELLKEVASLGIRSNDIGTKNFGIKNKTLILLDIGSGDQNMRWIEKEPYSGHISQESKNP